MKIACLGWGSLIWRPENLPLESQWFLDGPLLPIEFTRLSDNGRLTLVLTPDAKPVQTLWAIMATELIHEAIDLLRIREGIGRNLNNRVTSISSDEHTDEDIKKIIKQWAVGKDLDAVIWTNLPSRFNGIENRIPTIDEAINYLNSPHLSIETKNLAEEYIRRAPKQIDTEYRKRFETEFVWHYID